jgi:hypothetical protein
MKELSIYRLLEGIDSFLQRKHGIGIDSEFTDKQLEEAIYSMATFDSKNNSYLPLTSRAVSKVNDKLRVSNSKYIEFFNSKNAKNLYTLLIELPSQTKLYSKETTQLAKNITSLLKGEYWYKIEAGQTKNIHIHVILHSKNPPKKKLTFNGATYPTRPWVLNQNNPEKSKLEGLIAFTKYLLKVPDARYKGTTALKLEALIEEVREALNGDRERVILSRSNINTKHLKVHQKVRDLINQISSK